MIQSIEIPSTPHVPRQWEAHYRRLQSMRDLLQENCSARISEISDSSKSRGTDLADGALDEFERFMTLELLSQEENALYELNAAIRRVLGGTYGICEQTGRRIPNARLRVLPWTRFTKEAAETLEKRVAENPRQSGTISSIHAPTAGDSVPAAGLGPCETLDHGTDDHQKSKSGQVFEIHSSPNASPRPI